MWQARGPRRSSRPLGSAFFEQQPRRLCAKRAAALSSGRGGVGKVLALFGYGLDRWIDSWQQGVCTDAILARC